MRRPLAVFSMAFLMVQHSVRAQPLTVDPESVVPLPGKFDMEIPASDVPPEIARFQGAWIGTWHDDRHILVVERARFELLHGVPGDGHLLRLYPDRWRPIADEFLASLNRRSP